MARTDGLRTPGPRKFLSDSLAVLEIHALPMIRQWYLIVLGTLVFPIPMFYVFRSIAPDDAAVWQRLLAGTLIFGVSFSTAMLAGQQIVAQRFMGHLKLIITMPVSKAAFVVGNAVIHRGVRQLFPRCFYWASPLSPAWRSPPPGPWLPRCC